jgi:hypothetical protein
VSESNWRDVTHSVTLNFRRSIAAKFSYLSKVPLLLQVFFWFKQILYSVVKGKGKKKAHCQSRPATSENWSFTRRSSNAGVARPADFAGFHSGME